jgi:alkaline phosphatase
MYKAFEEQGYKIVSDADELKKADTKDRTLGIFTSQQPVFSHSFVHSMSVLQLAICQYGWTEM